MSNNHINEWFHTIDFVMPADVCDYGVEGQWWNINVYVTTYLLLATVKNFSKQ